MTDPIRVTEHTTLRWQRTPVVAIGVAGAALLVAAGLAFSRPDIVGIGLPLALTTAWMLVRRPTAAELRVELRAQAGADGEQAEARGEVDVHVDADWVQLAVAQDKGPQRLADVGVGRCVVTTRTRLQHSGPVDLLSVTARCVALDGAWITDEAPPVGIRWNTPPRVRHIGGLPVAPRLTGLHGAHEGGRPGQGGGFRDIHPFAPGDELRRVDWRATARAARRPGELLVRRNNTLSDSSVVIAVDTAEDLGAVVAGWGAADPDRSGVTSLDLAREAALSIATTAVGAGDRIAYHALSSGGRSIPSGGGARHLARMRDVIAATGPSTDGSPYRRSPVVPSGSIVYVLSTFFDGVAAQLATRWRAAGHAVVAVDVLPTPDASRLTREQHIALRTVLAERTDILTELRHAGIEVVSWAAPDVDAAMRLAALRQQRMRAVRR
ncbi:DUF58 domain-containing protein [Microbacterium oxydans]|uniref:DUF58 domain-containing protein n=1 Tax=Microbacterium sp. B19(2022) TaxID=2914045 RepID=UPI001430DA23|nr:DUF58 domain-containing protein [Microbacterium sp. B19(2022)]NJI59031.1 DUF58 domain-containing protein [Microbacterium sp. B19(2022)]